MLKYKFKTPGYNVKEKKTIKKSSSFNFNKKKFIKKKKKLFVKNTTNNVKYFSDFLKNS